jgi:AcrR family transcriptional regulator
MDHRSEPRPGGRSARVRSAVLAAAFERLTQNGLAALTIADVAKASGVHETSIYRRWKTVAALALDACLEFAADTVPMPDTGSLRSDLIALSQLVVRSLESPATRALIECRFTNPDPSQIAEIRRGFWAERLDAARGIFERAARRGELDPGCDVKFALELLIAPLYLRALATGEPLAEWPIETAVDAILRAVEPSRASHSHDDQETPR